MKTTIQAIYAACGKQCPTDADTLKAIDFLSELIDENHSLSEPDEFTYDTTKPEFYSFDSNDEFIESLTEWQEHYEENLQEYQEENESNYSELFDAIEELESKLGDDDFYFEYDGNEYRIISESAIWDIYVEEIQSTVEDCYDLKLDKIPSFIEFSIDWEATAKNCYADGYGHHFSGYDGSELEIGDYYVFRTN